MTRFILFFALPLYQRARASQMVPLSVIATVHSPLATLTGCQPTRTPYIFINSPQRGSLPATNNNPQASARATCESGINSSLQHK
ncbi:hypothetical protein BDV32DRAFT_115362 [Aspergillus pseudonomiae]|uniref:Uncharacterized protein n=1 Tax=Aspergillus pseudonomiae TaxID=1506151 RepID=A0A5N7CXN0_9EURO|nr:uncharacterized protein BDV37DRAFT_262593 [Aspergillus pseudonomiae]KAB8266263.1 hypothetical protein BDV32DRAFT_115362 [Aspergillus pseudonomiae]KAE8398699.1 hypothetical protein BDV37DRAFT_262593 [Aspergillus pseudonomiae]